MFEECYAAILHYEKCNPIDLQNVLFYKLLTIYLWAPSNAADRFSVSISWGQISCSNFVSLRNCLMYRNGFRVLYLQRFARKNIEWKIIHLIGTLWSPWAPQAWAGRCTGEFRPELFPLKCELSIQEMWTKKLVKFSI